MDDVFLCIADPNGRVACFLKAGDAGLEFVSGTPGAEAKVGGVMTDLLSRGVHARVESFSSGRVGVDFVRIQPDDSRYLRRAAAEFRARGWSAAVYTKQVADLWRRLYVLPVPQDVRASIAEHLDAAPVSALEALASQLERAQADLDRLAAQPPT